MDSKLIEFIFTKVKEFAIVSLFMSTITIIFFGLKMGMDYYLGFFIGVLNFIALSVGSSKIILAPSENNKRKSIGQSLYFFFRYFIVAALLVVLIKYQNANVFALVIGFLTIHISLLISGIPNFIGKRKEG